MPRYLFTGSCPSLTIVPFVRIVYVLIIEPSHVQAALKLLDLIVLRYRQNYLGTLLQLSVPDFLQFALSESCDMLNAFRNAATGQIYDDRQATSFICLEALAYSDDQRLTGDDLLLHHVAADNVENWAWQKGAYAVPNSLPGRGELEGGVRLLVVQGPSPFARPLPSILLSTSVLDALNLPSCTLASFRMAPSGVSSIHLYPEGSTMGTCQRFGLVMRTPQKYEATLGGLSISHDFATGITSALIVGSKGAPFRVEKGTLTLQPAFARLVQQFKDCASMWTHPLFLPVAYLVCHAVRVSNYINHDLIYQVIDVEMSVGVTTAGRSKQFSNEDDRHLFLDGQLQRDRAQILTKKINNLSTWIIFAQRSPTWDIATAKFCLALLEKHSELGETRGALSRDLRETLEYVQNFSEAMLDVTQAAESRMQLQLNILYTSVAQDDGQTSARIAVTSGKDSTSMKILALITAAYLPGTFVATLFSMGMFSWPTGQDATASHGESAIVSRDFWIYWAVAVPLTIITLCGWAIWWKFEEFRFNRKVKGLEKPSEFPLTFKNPIDAGHDA